MPFITYAICVHQHINLYYHFGGDSQRCICAAISYHKKFAPDGFAEDRSGYHTIGKTGWICVHFQDKKLW